MEQSTSSMQRSGGHSLKKLQSTVMEESYLSSLTEQILKRKSTHIIVKKIVLVVLKGVRFMNCFNFSSSLSSKSQFDIISNWLLFTAICLLFKKLSIDFKCSSSLFPFLHQIYLNVTLRSKAFCAASNTICSTAAA